jgi:hypothetical protein
VSQTPEQVLKGLQNSASEWLTAGWFFLLAGIVGLGLMILTSGSAQWHILPVYWFLAIWSIALGIAYFYLWKTLGNLRNFPQLDRRILSAVESVRSAFRFTIYLEIGFALGVLFLYPPALLFVIGGIVVQIRYFSEKRDTLAQLEENVEKVQFTDSMQS